MIIGTAGHIDHGKTMLVKALTGVDCDRLPEEKARGITLDLGFAYAPLADGEVLGFVDAPGHERLIHNMLAGATGIDFVLLVVAADDGVMPQTREHLELMTLLGIDQGAVALSKCDVVDTARQAAVEEEVRALLAGTPLAAAPLFRVSSKTGAGIAKLRAFLVEAARRQPARAARGSFRLAIDRVFTLAGIGTVVTGTAHAGVIHLGDEVVVLPEGLAARVKSLHVQGRASHRGGAGDRIALALPELEKNRLARGMWVVAPALVPAVVSRFHAELTLPPSAKPLKHMQPAHLYLGAADVTGRVALLEPAGEVAAGVTALVEILCDEPLHALIGDRFVLRDAAAQRTVGGGRVLDIFPPTRHKRRPEHLARLAIARDNDPRAALIGQASDAVFGVDLARFALAWNLTATEAEALEQTAGLKVVCAGDERYGFLPERWRRLEDNVIEVLRREHQRSPDLAGTSRERLRRMALPQLPMAVFAALIEALRQAGRIAQTQSFLHLPEHRPRLTEADRALFSTLKPLLAARPFNPPRVRDVFRASGVPEERVRQLFQRLSRAGELYPIAHDHYFTAEAIARLQRIVAEMCQENGAVRAADFRDRIYPDGSGGRKVAIQILEFFDRIGYTRRIRDEHRLRAMRREE